MQARGRPQGQARGRRQVRARFRPQVQVQITPSQFESDQRIIVNLITKKYEFKTKKKNN